MPLPDLNSLPSDFIDHLLLITQAIAHSKPGSSGAAHSEGQANGQKQDDEKSEESNARETGPVSLPLPRFNTEQRDERTQQIEANLSALVERLWRAEDHLGSIAQEQKRAQEGTHAGEEVDRRAFPYPLSQAHPQSSSYPLSYPLGFDQTGPVLLTPAKHGETESAEGAVGAFERYSDESGLSAQEELRLLKAQVQDIARVCKVSGGDDTELVRQHAERVYMLVLGCCVWRPVAAHYGARPGPRHGRAQRHHQPDGRSSVQFRCRGDPCVIRSRNARKTGRPSRSRGSRRPLEGA